MTEIKERIFERNRLQLGTLILTSMFIYSFNVSQQLMSSGSKTLSTSISSSSSSNLLGDAKSREYQNLKRLVDERVLNQRDVCKNMLNKTKDLRVPDNVRERLIVDEKRKLIYCPIPKAGSSNWKRIFVKLLIPEFEETNLLNIRNVHHIELPKLSSLSPNQQAKYLKTFDKFVWVRHPFERILSAFQNKLERPFTDKFQMWYGRQIVKKFRPNASEDSLERGNDVSSTEFIKYLIKTG